MPRTVVDAVLARVHRLTPAAREVVEQLAVVPTQVEQTLLRTLCPDLGPVAEAERIGVLEVRPGAVAFRHELARRAVVESLPVTVRLDRNARVAAALLAGPAPDLARVLHHAVEAGDDAAVVRHGPTVAREASRAGAHRQAVAAYEQVLARSVLLDPVAHAALLDAHAWSLYNINRLHDAAAAAGAAVALAERHGGPGAGPLPRHPVAAAVAAATHGGRAGQRPPRGRPRPRRGTSDPVRPRQPRRGAGARRPRGGGPAPPRSRRRRPGARGAGPQLPRLGPAAAGRPRRARPRCSTACAAARELGQHEYVMRGYYNLAEGLWRLGRHAEAAPVPRRGGRVRPRPRLPGPQLLRHGPAAAAAADARGVGAGRGRCCGACSPSAPIPACSAARPCRCWRGCSSVRALTRRPACWTRPPARPGRPTSWSGSCPPGWRTSSRRGSAAPRPIVPAPGGAAADWAALLRARTDRRGAAHFRGELLRWLRRLGEPVTSFPGCPPEFAAGIDGDWRAAAAEWERIGDPYERALELLESGEPEPTLEALAVLDGLGARPAAALARRRLRELGVAAVPRGPAAATPDEPGRADRAAGRDPAAAGVGDDQRRDRGAAGGVGADRRPPRVGGAAEAGGRHPPRGGGRRGDPRPRLTGHRSGRIEGRATTRAATVAPAGRMRAPSWNSRCRSAALRQTSRSGRRRSAW